ncbi:PP2C family protein-serine/threonine phosphatase [Actinoplanes sp. NPDC051343]|uniref:PP2C family protein-serine/threonine phosphatase n=1 Tax=Actinoplanes sp. NPDC051343 TaxID=3363906 RepID=UPI00379615DC
MGQADTTQWFGVLDEILSGSHLWRPDQLAPSVDAAVVRLGMRTTVWLVDYEQIALRALPVPGRETPSPVLVDGSLPGRAFARVESMPAAADDGRHRWWVPMVNGTDRLGVVEFVVAAGGDAQDADFVRRCELLAGLVGHLITTSSERGDHFDVVRRSRGMSTASELLWQMVPPLTASCDRAVVSAVLQPCYEVGGDGFDYTLDGAVAHLVILDAVGKGLGAALACAVALAAIRAERRAGRGLREQAGAADVALLEQFSDARFATAVLGELDLDTGRLRYLNAGHPAPLLLRDGKLVQELPGARRMPLGLADPETHIAEARLEPDDRLLFYTDGVTEARTPGGERFGLSRLVGLVEGHARSNLAAPEVLRRLAHAVIEYQGGPPDDDATLLLVEWSEAAVPRTVPTTGRSAANDEDR